MSQVFNLERGKKLFIVAISISSNLNVLETCDFEAK